MKLLPLALAVAVLAVLSAVVFFVTRPAPPPSADPRAGRPLADAGTLEKAVRLRLADTGKAVDLVKQADGTWRIPGYYDLPADLAKLARFVSDFTEAKIQRLVTSSPERIGRLEFKDQQFAVLDASGRELWSVTLGKNADGGGRFVRFGAEQKAYLASLNATLDLEAKNWADSQLVNLKADDIARLELTFSEAPGAVTAVARAKKEEPFAADKTPAGMRLKAESVSGILNSFTSLRFADTFALDDPQAATARAHTRTVKLTTFAGRSVSFALSQKPAEKIIKAPAPADAAKGGPAAALSAPAAGAKAEAPAAAVPAQDGPAKTLEPATETVPAGPAFVFITDSEAKAPVNALMQKRTVTIYDYLLTSLPQKLDDLFEPLPPPPAPAAPAKADTPPPPPAPPGEPNKP